MIDIDDLKLTDLGRLIAITDDELGSTWDVVLVDWTHDKLIVAWPDAMADHIAICPGDARLTDRWASLEVTITRDGDLDITSRVKPEPGCGIGIRWRVEQEEDPKQS